MVKQDNVALNTRIEKIRKGNFMVKFIDIKGKPPGNKKITYSMTRLNFNLGTVLYWSIFKRPPTDIDRKNYLEKINAYFNTVLILINWQCMEPGQGEFEDDNTPMQIWQWCHDHGKATFGHAIFYGYNGLDDIDPADTEKPMIRPWVKALGKRKLEKDQWAYEAFRSYILTVLPIKYGGRIYNE